MGKVMMSGVAPKMKVPLIFSENFSDNTWEQIVRVCEAKKVPDTWFVGNSKPMTIGGTNYAIDIIGKNHDDYSDGSGKAPLTFQMHYLYHTGYRINSASTNVGGWSECEMRNITLPEIMNLMPDDVKFGIKEVSKKTSEGNMSSKIIKTSEKLFLLSEIEIFGSTTNSFSGEGSQYEYYKAGNSKKKNKPGYGYGYWWERSPYSLNSNKFCNVASDGTEDSSGATGANNVSFAFCF